jgi:hypothetical protein
MKVKYLFFIRNIRLVKFVNYFIIIRGNGPTIRSYESRVNGPRVNGPDSGTIGKDYVFRV